MTKRDTVVVVGTGQVATMTAAFVAMRGAEDVVLLGVEGGSTDAAGTDINRAGYHLGFPSVVRRTSSYEEAQGARVVVIATGTDSAQAGTVRRSLEKNAPVLRQVAGRVRDAAPDALVIVATDPVELMCHEVVSMGIRPERVLGLSGEVAAALFASHVATASKGRVRQGDVASVVLGITCDPTAPAALVAVPSLSSVNGAPLSERLDERGVAWAVAQLADVGQARPPRYGVCLPAAALARMVTALLAGDTATLLCAAQHHGEYGIHGLFTGGLVVVEDYQVREIKTPELPDADARRLEPAARRLGALLEGKDPM